MFEIKYAIFPDNIKELKTIDLATFEKEFNDIYGTFTLLIYGKSYLPYPETFNIPIDALRIYSELLVLHLEVLVDAVEL